MIGQENSIAVVGGGASGMMAALTAARAGASVCLIEQNEKLGRKLYITGKGRCNVTNRCAVEQVLAAIPTNSRFLHSAMRQMPPEQVEQFFTDMGVALKVERGNRVFPVSDRAADIIDALFFALKRQRVNILHTQAEEILHKKGKVVGVRTRQGDIPCQAVILATGGVSYPSTGSRGVGHEMARAVGHTIVPLQASLVGLESPDACCEQLQGLTLKNISLTVKNKAGKKLFEEQGELLFTHFGISGPLVLSASARLRAYDKEQYRCVLDLKPALDDATLEARILREVAAQPNITMGSLLQTLLPRAMGAPILLRAEILPRQKAHELTKLQRKELVAQLKGFTIDISAPRPIAQAIVTAGGVTVGEVNPKSMESKKLRGLFFAGELLDVDAYTGGFNLQIAWATGYAAGVGSHAYVVEQ